MNIQPVGYKAKAFGASLRAFLLFFCVIFSLRFWKLLFHEGGHALPDLIAGNVIKVLYAHPFTFGGWVTPTSDTVISAAAEPVMMVLVPLLLFILIWKHRSVALLPLVMLFPWAAMEAGMNGFQITQMGDYHNIIHLTGLPEAVIVITAEKLHQLASIYTTPGFCDEILHIFLGTRIFPTAHGPKREEGELSMTPLTLTLDEAVARIEDGTLKDAKTIIGVLLAARRLCP